jgi:hypothetical protein
VKQGKWAFRTTTDQREGKRAAKELAFIRDPKVQGKNATPTEGVVGNKCDNGLTYCYQKICHHVVSSRDADVRIVKFCRNLRESEKVPVVGKNDVCVCELDEWIVDC